MAEILGDKQADPGGLIQGYGWDPPERGLQRGLCPAHAMSPSQKKLKCLL